MTMELQGKRIVLGVTGGIAAYKAAELVRLLGKAGANVQVVMTEGATHFVTPVTFQALSGRTVYTDQWDGRIANNMAHIDLSREADLILVAPASADFLAKVAHGLADDLLTTMVLARDCPLLAAPAMNKQMWENPATQRNVATLTVDGVTLLGPGCGEQACGETGDGRMLEPEEIVEDLIAFLQPKHLAGKKVLITAGPTFEAIDPVRGITNLSSGKMGFAVARAAREAGAEVTLVCGPVSQPTPRGVTRIDVTGALEMHAAVMARAAARMSSSALLLWPTTGHRQPPSTRSRRMVVLPRPSRWCRTRTSWPKSPPCPTRRCASALPPRARTSPSTRRRSGWQRRFR
jgi:phosphopantothenoylcysteine decarboxylase/phosphopantothenate--cysteine ligase